MPTKLALARRRSSGAVAVLLLLLLAGKAAASQSRTAADDGNDAAATSRRWSSSLWLWQQGRPRHAARRLLLAVQPESTATAVGKDTNEFHVEGVRRPATADGKLAGAVEFNAGDKPIPDRKANRRHN